MKKLFFVGILLLVVTSLSNAYARDTELLIEVKEAVERQAKGDLLDVPYFLKGQKHPKIKKKLGHWSSSRKGRGAFQSDLDACSRTFVTAIKTLQQRVQREGGNAVVNITSYTRDVPYEDKSKFRCVAGNIVVHVALEGDVVVLEK